MASLSRLLFFLKIFVLSGAGLALFIRAVTTEAMPWWPDTAIFGAVMGAAVTLGVYSHQRDRRAWRRWRDLGRVTRRWWKTRNTV